MIYELLLRGVRWPDSTSTDAPSQKSCFSFSGQFRTFLFIFTVAMGLWVYCFRKRGRPRLCPATSSSRDCSTAGVLCLPAVLSLCHLATAAIGPTHHREPHG